VATSPAPYQPTFPPLVVGLDGSPASAAALAWAARLAERVGAEVVVAHAFEPDQAEVSPAEYAELREAARLRLADDWSDPLRGTGIPHRAVQVTGAPEALLDAADAEGAALLVVGTRGPGRRPALHMGSVAHRLAHHSRGPLAIVPLADQLPSGRRLLVGVDGSAGSDRVLTWAADLARAAGAAVTVVGTLDGRDVRGSRAKVRAWIRAAEEAMHERCAEPFAAAGVDARSRIVETTHPLTALEAAAREEEAGWIVVGTPELSQATGLRASRLPLQLLHHTRLPVILVPFPQPPVEGDPAGLSVAFSSIIS
jgi:nucleotide-binding universal stress UspA family protein